MNLTPLTKLAFDAIKIDLDQFLRTADSVPACMRFATALEEISRELLVMRKAVLLKQAQLWEEAERALV